MKKFLLLSSVECVNESLLYDTKLDIEMFPVSGDLAFHTCVHYLIHYGKPWTYKNMILTPCDIFVKYLWSNWSLVLIGQKVGCQRPILYSSLLGMDVLEDDNQE